jgi:hypothetical protein
VATSKPAKAIRLLIVTGARERRSAERNLGPVRFEARHLDQAEPSHQAEENRAHAAKRNGTGVIAAHALGAYLSYPLSGTEGRTGDDPVAVGAGMPGGRPCDDGTNSWQAEEVSDGVEASRADFPPWGGTARSLLSWIAKFKQCLLGTPNLFRSLRTIAENLVGTKRHKSDRTSTRATFFAHFESVFTGTKRHTCDVIPITRRSYPMHAAALSRHSELYVYEV